MGLLDYFAGLLTGVAVVLSTAFTGLSLALAASIAALAKDAGDFLLMARGSSPLEVGFTIMGRRLRVDHLPIMGASALSSLLLVGKDPLSPLVLVLSLSDMVIDGLQDIAKRLSRR